MTDGYLDGAILSGQARAELGGPNRSGSTAKDTERAEEARSTSSSNSWTPGSQPDASLYTQLYFVAGKLNDDDTIELQTIELELRSPSDTRPLTRSRRPARLALYLWVGSVLSVGSAKVGPIRFALWG